MTKPMTKDDLARYLVSIIVSLVVIFCGLSIGSKLGSKLYLKLYKPSIDELVKVTLHLNEIERRYVLLTDVETATDYLLNKKIIPFHQEITQFGGWVENVSIAGQLLLSGVTDNFCSFASVVGIPADDLRNLFIDDTVDGWGWLIGIGRATDDCPIYRLRFIRWRGTR